MHNEMKGSSSHVQEIACHGTVGSLRACDSRTRTRWMRVPESALYTVEEGLSVPVPLTERSGRSCRTPERRLQAAPQHQQWRYFHQSRRRISQQARPRALSPKARYGWIRWMLAAGPWQHLEVCLRCHLYNSGPLLDPAEGSIDRVRKTTKVRHPRICDNSK